MRIVPSWLRFIRESLASGRFSGEWMGTERILAAVRVVLALTSLFAVHVDSTRPFQHDTLVNALLLFYCAHSISVLVMVYWRHQITAAGAWGIHCIDILWPTVIALFTNGPNSPFFLFFIFALLGAAFRWGMYPVLLTAMAAVSIVTIESVLLNYRALEGAQRPVFALGSFIVRSAYLVSFSILIAYLSESEKRRREQAITIARISARARVDSGLKGTLHGTFYEVLNAFGAREILLIANEASAQNAQLWRMEMLPGMTEPVFTSRQLDAFEEEQYLVDLPEFAAGAAWRKGKRRSAATVRSDGTRMPGVNCLVKPQFAKRHRFRRLLLSTVSAAPGVSGRVFLFEPSSGGDLTAQLRFLQELTTQVTPAIYNVYLLRRLRSRTAAVERARVARDLHDGVIQSLHAIALRLYALRTSNTDRREREAELLDLQELVQKEAANIRSLIQQLKPIDVDPRHVVDFLSSMIERYRYDTGISAEFVCDVPDLSLPANTCREVARIVQEALANVLKHSGAENVLVRLGSERGLWTLVIEDNGRGFEFAGRLDTAALERTRRGPFVIKERVRAIGGEISIESRPGQGARLEITFPKTMQTTSA